MIPTPTPIIMSDPSAVASGTIPWTVWALLAVALGLQALKFYRRRKMALQSRAGNATARKNVKPSAK